MIIRDVFQICFSIQSQTENDPNNDLKNDLKKTGDYGSFPEFEKFLQKFSF
jgi:hypothetical protein